MDRYHFNAGPFVPAFELTDVDIAVEFLTTVQRMDERVARAGLGRLKSGVTDSIEVGGLTITYRED